MASKVRLDILLVQRGFAESEKIAQAIIMSGKVIVNGNKIDKPGTQINPDSSIELKKGKEFVGRGAYKLEGALQDFNLTVQDLICADVGASTGGFTEVLLRAGAKKVYSIDVGFGELDYKLRQDPRVVVMERTNARTLVSLPELVHFVSIDVSFISLKLILPVVKNWLVKSASVLCLIKPQFEARQEEVGEGGIVTNSQVQRRVVSEIMDQSLKDGLFLVDLAISKIQGTHGNQEFFLLLSNTSGLTFDKEDKLDKVISVSF